MPPPDVFGRTIDDDEEFTLGLNMNPSLSESRKDLGLQPTPSPPRDARRPRSPSLFGALGRSASKRSIGRSESNESKSVELTEPPGNPDRRPASRNVSWATERTPQTPREPRSPQPAQGSCAGFCEALDYGLWRCWRVFWFCITIGYCVAWGTSCCGPAPEETGDKDEDLENAVLRDQFSYTLQARYDRERWRDDYNALAFPSGLSPKASPRLVVVPYPGDWPKTDVKVHALQRSRAAAGQSLYSRDKSTREIEHALTGSRNNSGRFGTKRFSVENMAFDPTDSPESGGRLSPDVSLDGGRPSSGDFSGSRPSAGTYV
mmetsp:Transcript_25332/g.76075  ORF Transcript_25332/g.76075 Transcript_25332/m.76075 type:complete len:318 (+) Transcript_25332:434-1387(+)